MAPARRTALIEWAARTRGLIIEDDYDAEFRYDRTPIGAVQGLNHKIPVAVDALWTVLNETGAVPSVGSPRRAHP